MKNKKYKHYKWGEYEVIAFAKNESDLQDVVVYRCLYPITDLWEDFSKDPIFVRPYDVFFSEVQAEDGTMVPRFAQIDEN